MKTEYRQLLKKVCMVLPFYLFTFLPLSAQTYLEHLQTNTKGLGTVSVHQGKDIDNLVNGTITTKPAATPTATPSTATTAATTKPTETKAEEPPKEETKEKERVALKPDMPKTDTEGTTEPEVDMSKKVMRNSYKVTGFRVQAYAGGNSREDKRKAEEARDKIKRAYPSEPVYVHFYSPRWICRVGNYRTQEEANRMLSNIRKLGYRQAVVVKGKITVQY